MQVCLTQTLWPTTFQACLESSRYSKQQSYENKYIGLFRSDHLFNNISYILSGLYSLWELKKSPLNVLYDFRTIAFCRVTSSMRT